MTVDNLEVITSTAEKPEELIVVPGRTEFSMNLINLVPFNPEDRQNLKLFKPGASGSPLVYKGHIVGLIPVAHEEERVQNVGAFLFRGKLMRDYMEKHGLTLEEIN